MLNFVMHRDISSNIFFAAFIFIQAVISPSAEVAVISRKLINFVFCAGSALLTFGVLARLMGFEWQHPASW
ncbi:hypothetical protein LK03_15000 [Pseudomonas cremoricolorata]|uniref:Uncharacterized protein n=2 Tax=Pseudomonas cremoricolorata TaxID=157783 RepID=A0A089WPK0_9PSED|nr:hypothetical protein LK03_15000 [Pseudomonas cremoricolorata]